MKTCWIALLLISSLLLLWTASLAAFDGTPRCTLVEPDTAKTGDTVSVTCQNVSKATVADLYLTDGKNDTKISVMDQSADKIKFQVPNIKPGRYHIAFLTANKASFVEEPVVLTVQ